MALDTTRGTVQEALEGHGFELVNMGGNTTAWTRMCGTAEELITNGDGSAPDEWADPAQCHVDAYGPAVDSPMTTMADVIDYLDANGGDFPLNMGDGVKWMGRAL